MKRILLFTLCLLCATPSFSETRQDIYLVGITTDFPKDFAGIFDGFIRIDLKHKSYHKDNPIAFHIGNSGAGYEVMLYHFNYYNKERPDLLIRDMKISDMEVLQNAEKINIDEFFADKTKEEVWQWMVYHHLSKTNVWVVDYNSVYKSSESQSEPDMVKAVQVRINVDTIPKEPKYEYYKTYNEAHPDKD